MPVVSGAEFLKAARKGGYAVGGYNTNNLEWTQAILEAAEAKKAPVLIQTSMGAAKYMGGYKVAKDMITNLVDSMNITGIDYLACGIGNIHGQYPENWKGLAFDHLQAIAEAVGSDVPLVLHGGSGIPQEQIEKAISLGISKVNVNTEFQLSFAKATREYIEAGKDLEGKGFDPRKLLAPGKAAIIKDAEEHIDWFGSANKA